MNSWNVTIAVTIAQTLLLIGIMLVVAWVMVKVYDWCTTIVYNVREQRMLTLRERIYKSKGLK